MRKSIYAIALAFAALATGCINNDVPFPQIAGNVTEIEVEGASNIVIDQGKRTVSFDLDETVDIRAVKIKDFRITPDARIIDNYTKQELDTLDSPVIDLTQGSGRYEIQTAPPYTFTVITYQEYTWTLVPSQPVDRYINIIGDQIGEAQFSSTSNTVVVSVSEETDLSNIQFSATNGFKIGPRGAVVTPNPYEISDFTLPRTFTVSYLDIVEEWTVIFEVSQEYIASTSINPWTSFAYLTAEGMTSAGTCGFQVRPAANADSWWEAVEVEVAGRTFTGKIEGLTPSVEYVVRAYVGDHFGEEVSFKADDAVALPNLSLDVWTQNDKGTWYPNGDYDNSFWASGNQGATTVNRPSITVPTSDAVKGQAAELTTIANIPIAKIAAGNLFVGDFYITGLPLTTSAMRKSPKFGRAYTGRPLKFKGWFKYSPKPIDVDTDNMYPELMGTLDIAHIYISLENWDGATARPLGTEETSLDHWSVLGYGEFQCREQVSSYTPFEIDITYKDKSARPTHIVIVATASRYGGDFCGGTGSVLHLDEFELEF